MSFVNELLRRALFLPPQATRLAAHIDWLHFVVISLTMFGATAITLLCIVFCVRYRRRERPHARRVAAPTPFVSVELSIVGGLFALFVALWAVGYWQYVSLVTPPADTYDVYVSAKQWMWKFAYPEGRTSIDTLYVPAGRPVRLILTSRDVIHSFFVPDFRVKHDAVPGRYTTVWFDVTQPGTHPILCTEYCGTWHSRMRGEVVALSATDFQRWLRDGERERAFPLDPDSPPPSAADSSLTRQGERVAAHYGCLRCHSVDGSPHIGPTWAGLYGARVPLANGESVLADVAYLTESMMDPPAKLHRGFDAVMPSYFGYLGAAEVGGLVAYIRSLRSAADSGQPAPEARPASGTFHVPQPELPRSSP